MASFPFQQHPTFAEYLRLAEDNGCEVHTGHIETVVLIRLVNKANGNMVVQAGVKQTEHLTPSLVAKLDRRLGLESPWNPGFADD